MNSNAISIAGNLVDNPELRYTPNGHAAASIRIAVNRRVKNPDGEWVDGEPSFFTVNAWRTLAENVAESLRKGDRVVVIGELRQRSWEGDDGKRTVIEIEAEEIAPSLRWATAAISKTQRPAA